MISELPTLIGSINSDNGYLTSEWLERLRTFNFSLPSAARFLAWLPGIKPHLACCSVTIEHGANALGSAVEFIEFHTGGWSGAEELISVMLGQFWITHFHTKWTKGGHFYFEVSATLAGVAAPPAAAASHEIAPLNEIVGFMLFAASRSGSWAGWQLFGPDERQRFLEWAQQELAHLETRGWELSVQRRETHPISVIEAETA
jgi:hypothetical protein